jgi:hypothetical protein
VPELIDALHDEDSFCRFEALHALGRIGSEARDAIPALVAILKEEPNYRGPPLASVWFALRAIDPATAEAVGIPQESVRGRCEGRQSAVKQMSAGSPTSLSCPTLTPGLRQVARWVGRWWHRLSAIQEETIRQTRHPQHLTITFLFSATCDDIRCRVFYPTSARHTRHLQPCRVVG